MEQGYLHACASGTRTLKNVSSIAREILDASIINETDKALIDIRQLEGRLSIFDSLLIITKEFPAIQQLRVLNKAAIVDAEDRRERSEFFERIARSRDYNIRIFEDVQTAIEWISEDK
jgi:hypothetical protein